VQTRLTPALGIEQPVISAPMGFAAGGRLAAAVSGAGGLGLIGGGYGDAEWLERELAQPQTINREEARHRQADRAGDAEGFGVLTGEGAGLIRDIAPAAELLRRLVREAEAVIGRAGEAQRQPPPRA